MNGIFILAQLSGSVAERLSEIQRRYDPKLAAEGTPHITLVGSSGAGPIPSGTPTETVRRALEPIAASAPPLTLRFGPAQRFMQTEIVSLPLDPHGPLRTLHERIVTSGLPFLPSRFPFSPHCTLSFYPTLSPDTARALLAIRIPDPVRIDRLHLYLNADPQPAQALFDLSLDG